MRLLSASETVASLPVSRRFLDDVFFSRMWFAFARRRLIFPDDVTLNLLATPLCDFIFGIFNLPPPESP